MESAVRCDAVSPSNRYRNYRLISSMPHKIDIAKQMGAAADRLGLGQDPDTPFARGRVTASARTSSDDEKVREHVTAVVAVRFHLLASSTKRCVCVCSREIAK